jgi:hypothetical protein
MTRGGPPHLSYMAFIINRLARAGLPTLAIVGARLIRPLLQVRKKPV